MIFSLVTSWFSDFFYFRTELPCFNWNWYMKAHQNVCEKMELKVYLGAKKCEICAQLFYITDFLCIMKKKSCTKKFLHQNKLILLISFSQNCWSTLIYGPNVSQPAGANQKGCWPWSHWKRIQWLPALMLSSSSWQGWGLGGSGTQQPGWQLFQSLSCISTSAKVLNTIWESFSESTWDFLSCPFFSR